MSNLQRARLVNEQLFEAGQHAALHVDAVGGDAGLPRVAPLERHELREGLVEVGVVEDDEGTVPAELERALLGPGHGAVAGHEAADRRRAREGDLRGERVGAEGLAEPGRGVEVGSEDVQRSWGESRAGGEVGESEHRKGCLRAGFDDHGAAGCEGGAGLAQDHGDGEVPGDESDRDADGLLDGEDAPALDRGLKDGALDAICLAGKPPCETEGVVELAYGFIDGFACFVGDDLGYARVRL